MTGRENIYMNGAIMGMNRAEITRKLDEIVDFSGCERYLDTPVKRYSSGMTVRLGFAIAAHLEPDILVVDEVLAVGDAEFQKKAIGKMQDVSRGEGRTVLFVSHNMGAVKNLCKRGIVLNQGQVAFDGGVEEAVDYYTEKNLPTSNELIINNIKSKTEGLSISKIIFNGTEATHSTITHNQETIDLLIEGETSQVLPDADVMVVFRKKNGNAVATFAEGHYKASTQNILPGSFHLHKIISLPKYMAQGHYSIDICIHKPNSCFYMNASSCALIQVEGNSDTFGRPLIEKRDGFLGLETI